MKKRLHGTFTIEAAIIIPLFLWVFAICVQLLFFSHDKVLIGALAYETAVYGSGRETLENEEIEAYFQRQVEGRTLVLHDIYVEVEQKDNSAKILCDAEKGRIKVHFVRELKRTEPENVIRTLRKIGEIK